MRCSRSCGVVVVVEVGVVVADVVVAGNGVVYVGEIASW